MHHNEIDNRIKKAQRIVASIDEHYPQATAGMLSLYSDDMWEGIAKRAGEKPLSNSTLSVVIALVRGREMAVEAIRGNLGVTGVRS